jgi:RES domain-containing protein
MATIPTHPFRAPAWSCREDGLPAASALDLISDRPNRWNGEGEPTIYLSGDAALALIEAGRHPDDLKTRSRLIQVDLHLPRAVDLREQAVRTALELPDGLGWVLDRERTRRIAQVLRRSRNYDGLLVPSAGALDQAERWNAVLFADDRGRVAGLVERFRHSGEVAIGSATS